LTTLSAASENRAALPETPQAAAFAKRPWLIRTYAGHSTAEKSNELYRGNLAKGQTGLSVAFDLPTQTGYDSDHVLARGEVGKVGVPIAHLGDMRTLFDQIPLEQMNTSMTINATAAWLLALYVAAAEEQGGRRREADRHGAERHHQGIPLPRHLHLPARARRCG
jgi:(2R)-ethylmalonyl-CoA mutase